jgi:capsular polysaccharide biosynthesis protein
MYPAAKPPQPVARATTRSAAEPAPEERGLTQRMVVNLLETFFKRPLIMLAPLLFTDLTGTQTAFAFETPSTITSRSIAEQINTDRFINRVIEKAGLTSAVEAGLRTRDQIRASISTSTRGDNLVAVSAVSASPQESQALATAALDAFREYVAENDVGDATFRAETLQQSLDDAKEQARQASQDLEDYIAIHPAGEEENRPINERIEVDRLTAAQARADELVTETQQQLDDALAEAQQAQRVVDRQLRTLDEPELPLAAEAGLKNMVLTVGVFVVLGSILSATLIVLAAIFDRSIRTPHDIEVNFGLDVLAVVPARKR